MSYTEENEIKNNIAKIVVSGVIALTLISILYTVGYQWFRVFESEQAGKAELAQAEWNRQIIVRQAQAKKDAATLEADAEVSRAEGVAKANKIVADGLGGAEGYLRYLYIHMLSEQTDKQIIYIPTEAGLPILEASKR